MGIGYQTTDRAAFDYKLWYLPGTKVVVRGPQISARRGSYVSFLGAAQTFGRFCVNPFPHQIGRFFEFGALNLGISGAGPDRYLDSPELVSYINHSVLAVLQVMSARSVSTDLLRTREKPRNEGVLTFQSGPLAGRTMMALNAYQQLEAVYGRTAFEEQVRAAQESWIVAHQRLLDAITVPVLLLWMSTGPPPEEAPLQGASLIGSFPHFVTSGMLDSLEKDVRSIVDASYEHERPQLLTNAQTGQVEEIFDAATYPGRPEWSRCFNTYYPTPEAHDHATRRLITHILRDPELTRLLEERP